MLQSMRSPRRTLLLPVLALLVAALLVAAPVAVPAPSSAAPLPVNVVVLGDSYSSGNGAGSYYGPEGCYRSKTSWAERYAEGLRQAGLEVHLRNGACSGAVTRDLTSERSMDSIVYSIPMADDRRGEEARARQILTGLGFCVPEYPEERYDIATVSRFDGVVTTFTFRCTRKLAPQVNSVDVGTDVVLLTIGGNDVRFADLVGECFIRQEPSSCRSAVSKATNLLGTVQSASSAALRVIGSRGGRKTRVGLISYPYLERNEDFTIASLTGGSGYRAGEAIRGLGRRGDEMQSRAVGTANSAVGRTFAFFVDGVKERFAGHEPDGDLVVVNAAGWIQELGSPISAEWYHPNLLGHLQYSRHLLESSRFGTASFD